MKYEQDPYGLAVEAKFGEAMKPLCASFRKATDGEDMHLHFDYVCDDVKYEVKAQKKLWRGDKALSDKYVWVEFRNVRGKRGWIKGEADKIAFQRDDEFLVVDRIQLFTWLKTKITDLRVVRDRKEYMKLGHRRSRPNEATTIIHYTDIEPFIEKRIKFEGWKELATQYKLNKD